MGANSGLLGANLGLLLLSNTTTNPPVLYMQRLLKTLRHTRQSNAYQVRHDTTQAVHASRCTSGSTTGNGTILLQLKSIYVLAVEPFLCARGKLKSIRFAYVLAVAL
jgi:hypothetical protein